jgi:ribose 5-phosphate isomerase
MKTAVNLPIAITATDRASMERQLDEAVAVAMTRAMHQGRQGILVTQHNNDSFTVDLSDVVPFGLTREYQEW